MFGFGKRKVELAAPIAGEVIPVSDVSDPMFSQKMLGEGFGVVPVAEAGSVDVCAPVAGELVQVFPTGHACGIRTPDGLDVLVHIGVDTVELKGDGFQALGIERGTQVSVGTPIIQADVARIRELGRDPVVIVVVTTKKLVAGLEVTSGKTAAGEKAAVVTKK
ncbi:PTS glucose transporter subunit IIA [Arcanobacterium haemolyticum]|nr:PTS glucose transporter subunit IIA [Arcanobacterium haemolyticum]